MYSQAGIVRLSKLRYVTDVGTTLIGFEVRIDSDDSVSVRSLSSIIDYSPFSRNSEFMIWDVCPVGQR